MIRFYIKINFKKHKVLAHIIIRPPSKPRGTKKDDRVKLRTRIIFFFVFDCFINVTHNTAHCEHHQHKKKTSINCPKINYLRCY